MSKPKRIVIDSSVIVKWLSSQDEKLIPQANKILQDAKEEKIELFTSELAKYEVGNALLTKKHLTPAQASISLATIQSLPVQFVTETEESAKQTYELGYAHKLTYYDAAFITVAKQYNAILITDNIKHQGKTKEVKVIALKDYKS